MAKQSQQSVEVEVIEVVRGELEFCIKGTTPIIFNRYSDKAKRELFMPYKKTKVEKETSLKHQPLHEFRQSVYPLPKPAKTYLGLPSTAVKSAMMTAALDMPGLTKTSIGRLVYVLGDYIEIYGKPEVFITMVRSAGMNSTPDVRTRAIVREWAAKIRVAFIKPQHKEKGIINLMAAAGITAGVGDFRPEKGKGTYGQFELTTAGDKDFKRVVNTGARDAQVEAMSDASPYDEDTRDLLDWFQTEAKHRGWEFTENGEAVKL